MNVSITIGDENRAYPSASKDWINKAFARARKQGVLPVVTVQISQPGLVLGLATPGSGRGGGGSLTPAQNRIVEAWMRHRMTSTNYTGGNLIAFLNDLERLIG
jgi:hypothetical protein